MSKNLQTKEECCEKCIAYPSLGDFGRFGDIPYCRQDNKCHCHNMPPLQTKIGEPLNIKCKCKYVSIVESMKGGKREIDKDCHIHNPPEDSLQTKIAEILHENFDEIVQENPCIVKRFPDSILSKAIEDIERLVEAEIRKAEERTSDRCDKHD